jgi:pyruvate kinase
MESYFTVRAKEKGCIYKNSSIFIPEKHGKLPVLRDEDIKDLENINKVHSIDFVMIPYIVSKDDVKEVKKKLGFLEKTVIISKLEDKRSFEEFWEITNESGGIFLHRANLSHCLSPEKLFSLTKFLTEQCNIMAKPCIVEISGING